MVSVALGCMDQLEHGLIDRCIEAMSSSQLDDCTRKGVDFGFPMGPDILQHGRFVEARRRKSAGIEVFEIFIGFGPERF